MEAIAQIDWLEGERVQSTSWINFTVLWIIPAELPGSLQQEFCSCLQRVGETDRNNR